MLYVAFPGARARAEFKRDIEGALRAFFGALPDAPPIAESQLAGPLVGKLDLTNEWRRPTGAGARAGRRRRARPPTRSGRSAAAGRCSRPSGWRRRSRRRCAARAGSHARCAATGAATAASCSGTR